MTYNVELTPAELWSGVVFDSSGALVRGAQVALKTPTLRLRLDGKPSFKNLDAYEFITTDAAGQFRLTPDAEASHLVVVHESGIAWIPATDLAKEMVVRLQPWGKIEGAVWENGAHVPGAGIVSGCAVPRLRSCAAGTMHDWAE